LNRHYQPGVVESGALWLGVLESSVSFWAGCGFFFFFFLRWLDWSVVPLWSLVDVLLLLVVSD
jgi:hypothetical protein